MKASELITEVFNSNVRAKLIKNNANAFIVKARIGDRDIKFTAAGGAGDWEIDFIEQHPEKGDTFGKTGSGGELQVFSFVIDCVKELIAIHQPDRVSFTSDKSDANRTKLYAKISRKVKIPGYHVDVGAAEISGYDRFSIIRDGATPDEIK